MNLIHSENNDIRKEIKAEIEIKVNANTRFSVTMDEYTPVRYRIYTNINAHCQNDVINLGLIRMLESCGAEKTLQLFDFRITNMQTSVVSIVADGASVMKKVGKITNSAMRMVCIWLCVMYCTKTEVRLILQVKITITTTIKMKKCVKKVLV